MKIDTVLFKIVILFSATLFERMRNAGEQNSVYVPKIVLIITLTAIGKRCIVLLSGFAEAAAVSID